MKKLLKIKNHIKQNGIKDTISWLNGSLNVRLLQYKNLQKMDYTKISLTKEEKQACSLKTTKQVFIFATVPFYDVGGGQRSAAEAKIFNKMGYRVNYIYVYKSSEKIIHNMEIPVCKHIFIDKYAIEDYERDLNKDDLVIFEAPHRKFISYIKVSNKANIIYENIDNWESSLVKDNFDRESLKLLLEKAKLLVATSKALEEQLHNYLKEYHINNKTVCYLANAVDEELFSPLLQYQKPIDLICGEKTLLYYGSLWGSWFDWDLIFEVAKKLPNTTINLIGDFYQIPKIVAAAPKNIHFLGVKKQKDLPAYLAYSDYALLPFKIDEVGTFVSPLKIFEYISMNKMVLTTPLPDVKNYPNIIFSDKAIDWIKQIEKEPIIDIQSKNNFMEENNWFNRVDAMIDNIYQENKEKCLLNYYNNISIIVLNYNNTSVIYHAIDTLLKYYPRYKYEIIVVDNQSSDGSYEKMLELYKERKEIKIIRNCKNGCASGRNLGVKESSKEYLFFMDSDQWVQNKYFLDNYLTFFNNTKNIGAVANSAGYFNQLGYSYRSVDSFPNRYMKPNCFARKDIGYLATCGFLMTKKLFQEIKGFDESYDPTCYEDTDLALNIRNANKEIYYCPYLGLGHLPHQTTKSGTSFHDKLIREKGDYFVAKWKLKNPKLLNYKKG